MNICSAWRKFLGLSTEAVMPTEQDAERRRLQEYLIEEHRRANAETRERLTKEIPAFNARYMETMDQAMAILRRD